MLREVTAVETKVCTRCGERKPIDAFYFVSKALGTRRGQCKPCMSDIKAMQKDPNWKPACSRCGVEMERFGPGRRLCAKCFNSSYELEQKRAGGSHRQPLKPCSACGVSRLRADTVPNTQLCGVCRSVSQGRRKRLKLYNLNPRDFLELLEDQSYQCWICFRPFTKQRPPHVDHQHAEPSIIRGLVCGTCNTILGLAKDDPDRLRGAAKYLEAPPAQYLFPGLCATPEANRNDGRSAYRPLKRVA